MFSNTSVQALICGRLSLEAIPYHEPILLATFVVVALGGAVLLGAVTWYGKWGYLWREWFTSVDHKKIGIMYIILGIIMLLRGFADALMMRTQQLMAVGGGEGYLPAHHYDQIFTAHGTIMIFFVAIPLVVGLVNFVMPLQIGARDVAFPFLNNLSLWLTVAGAVLTMTSLFVGEFARTGWLSYAPLAGLADGIVDLTATGRTLRENDLEIREVIAECTARLVANRVAHKLRQREIDGLMERIGGG